MYTIDDVRNIVFTRAGRGYRTEEVDEFIEEVVRSMEAMQQNNDSLVQKLGVLADKIEDYRAQEDSIHSALLTAQRMADQVMREAETKARELKETSERTAAEVETQAKERARQLTEQAELDYQTRLNDTKQQATKVIAEAKDRSGRMLFEALEKCRSERAALEEMKRQTQSFQAQLIAMYQEQIALIRRLASEDRNITVERPVSHPDVATPVEKDIGQPSSPAAEASVVPEPVKAEPAAIQLDAPEIKMEPSSEAAHITSEKAPAEMKSPEVPQPEAVEEPAKATAAATMSKVPGTAPARFQIDADAEEERLSKFSNLKFGDDYDLSDDEDYLEEEPSRGFFKKKKNKDKN